MPPHGSAARAHARTGRSRSDHPRIADKRKTAAGSAQFVPNFPRRHFGNDGCEQARKPRTHWFPVQRVFVLRQCSWAALTSLLFIVKRNERLILWIIHEHRQGFCETPCKVYPAP